MIKSVSITTKSNETILCDTHKSMCINTYCENHDDVICGTCKITDHMKCATTDVSDQKKNFNIAKSIDKVTKSFTDLKHQYKKLKETRKADINELKSELGKSLDDMRNMRKEINQTLDKLERKFEKEIKEIEARIRSDIENHVAIAEDALLQISNQLKYLGDCRKSKSYDVKFVFMKRAEKIVDKYDRTLSTVRQTIHPIQIKFRANDVIRDVIQHLKCIGTLVSHKHHPHSPTTSIQKSSSLLQMSVVNKRGIDVDIGLILGCTFMKSGHLVLAYGYKGLILLNESFKVQSQLSVYSMKVAAINENEVVVTQGSEKQLLRVRQFPKMVVMTKIKLDSDCYGVDVFNDEIYVVCYDGKGHGEVQVLNMEGKIQRKIGVNNGGYMFISINDVKVGLDGSKLFVSDVGTHGVTCLNQQGHVIYEYSIPDLKLPTGLYVDEDDTLLVCGCGSNNIHMVGRDGRKVKVWLTEEDGVVDPCCISYRQKDGCLVVGLYGKNPLAFNIKLK